MKYIKKKKMIEDFERIRELDEMYLIETQLEIEEEWYLSEQEKLPAKIEIIKTKEHDTSRDLQKRTKKIS